MEIVKLIGIGLSGAVAALVIKEHKPALAFCIGCSTATIIFLCLLEKIRYVLDTVIMIAGRLSFDTAYISIIIRIIGIACITRFGSELCRDAGQNAIAQKLELAGRIMIVVTSMPILTAVLNLLIGVLPK